jgi:hypothetical protein
VGERDGQPADAAGEVRLQDGTAHLLGVLQ